MTKDFSVLTDEDLMVVKKYYEEMGFEMPKELVAEMKTRDLS